MRKLYAYIIALFLVVAASLYYISKSRTFQFFGRIVSEFHTDKKVVLITFDDGPAKNTDTILSILKLYNVHACFFLTGKEIGENTALTKKIIAFGHCIGNHSYSHQRMVLKSPAFIEREVETTDKLIRGCGYTGEIYFRPPYCKKMFYLPYYLQKTKRTTITWNIEPDSDNKTPETILKCVQDQVKPGSIILLHAMYANRSATLEALPRIIEWLKSNGYTILTTDELMAIQIS